MLVYFLAQQSPGDLLKAASDPGYGQYVIYGLLTFFLLREIIGKPAVWLFTWAYNHWRQNKPRDVNLPQPFEVKEASVPANQKEFKEFAAALNFQYAALRTELTKQMEDAATMAEARHTERAVAAGHRVQDLSEVIKATGKRLEDRLDKEVTENRRGRGELHEKVNRAALQVAQVIAAVPHITSSIDRLEVRMNADIPNLHQRVNDCMAAASRAGRK